MNTNNLLSMENMSVCMAQAEEQAKKDSRRQRYHFRPTAQWMNDPNGTIYYDGYYHLFYQFHPYSDEWGSMHWGHARSRDLVNWEHLPVALFPEGQDEAHCASGCATINGKGTPMMFYTNFTERLEGGPYDQRIAFGDLELISWKRYSGNPFLGEQEQNQLGVKRTWRDPFIFQEAGRTFLILGAETDDRWLIPIYEAEDNELLNWAYRGNLYETPKNRPSHFLVECPNFVKIGEKWVLLYSPMGYGVEYQVGTFDVEALTFIPEQMGMFDQGYYGLSGFYATNVFSDPQGRCIIVGWIRGFTSGQGWNGCLSLPRVLTLGQDGHPRQTPVPELQQLREHHVSFSNILLEKTSRLIEGIQGSQLEILVHFTIQDARRCGLKLQGSDNHCPPVTISYDGETLDVDHVQIPLTRSENTKELMLHIFIDRSVMEVFVNNGQKCLTRVLWNPEKAWNVEVFAVGGKVTVTQLDSWEIKSIW